MCRGKREITESERYVIERCLKRKMNYTEIANVLGLTPQAVSYEVKKGLCIQRDTHLVDREVYSAELAQRVSESRKKITGRRKTIEKQDGLGSRIREGIKAGYSPYALKVLDEMITVSERTIYNYVRKKCIKDLSWRDMPYMKKAVIHKTRTAKMIVPSGYSIELRPFEISERKSFGNWEIDTIYSGRGSKNCLLTLTERKSRLEFSAKIEARTAAAVTARLRGLRGEVGQGVFAKLVRTITSDNGVEFKDYEGIETINGKRNPIKLFYAHPYRSGERGSNENQNRFIRRFVPKGDDISLYSNKDIKGYLRFINTYPRRIFNGKSSADMINEWLSNGEFTQKEIEKIRKTFCID